MQRVFVTGCCGFIGFQLCKSFLKSKIKVIGIDNCKINYENEKRERLKKLEVFENFSFFNYSICDQSMKRILQEYQPNYVFHLAAKVGVRDSCNHHNMYQKTNVDGTRKILEQIEELGIETKFIFASSSSVYGENSNFPWKESEVILQNKVSSFYAKTKVIGEKICEEHHKKNKRLLVVIFRFFTVYGDDGRRDMAVFRFSKSIMEEKEISLFNNGENERDFTHVSDIVNGITVLSLKCEKREGKPFIFNLGTGKSTRVVKIVEYLEILFKKKAKTLKTEKEKGDVTKTQADISKAKIYGYNPKISIEEGLKRFAKWFKKYDGVEESK